MQTFLSFSLSSRMSYLVRHLVCPDRFLSSVQLLSTFIMDVVDYPGVPGLFLAVLFAGALR